MQEEVRLVEMVTSLKSHLKTYNSIWIVLLFPAILTFLFCFFAPVKHFVVMISEKYNINEMIIITAEVELFSLFTGPEFYSWTLAAWFTVQN